MSEPTTQPQTPASSTDERVMLVVLTEDGREGEVRLADQKAVQVAGDGRQDGREVEVFRDGKFVKR